MDDFGRRYRQFSASLHRFRRQHGSDVVYGRGDTRHQLFQLERRLALREVSALPVRLRKRLQLLTATLCGSHEVLDNVVESLRCNPHYRRSPRQCEEESLRRNLPSPPRMRGREPISLPPKCFGLRTEKSPSKPTSVDGGAPENTQPSRTYQTVQFRKAQHAENIPNCAIPQRSAQPLTSLNTDVRCQRAGKNTVGLASPTRPQLDDLLP